MPFVKAVKAQSFLRLSLAGVSGSGKSFTAYTLASSLADGAAFAVIDTERGSASKYADRFNFDVLELSAPYHPDRYIAAIKEAQEAGYPVLVIDSLTHAWNGAGGLLEVVEQIAKRSYGGNTFRAWADGTPIQNRLIGAITGAPMHVIVTMRSKSDYVVEKDERTGKTTPRKVGMKVEQRDDMEYEYDVAGDMTPDHELIIRKSRCPELSGAVIALPGREMAATLRTWLSGAPAPQTAAPQPTPAPLPVRRQTPQQMQEGLDEADDGGEETIPYTPEEPETPATEEWKFLQDVEFRQVLNKLNIRTVAAIEEFVFAACADHGSSPQRETAMRAARELLAKRQPQKATRGRGPSALGATLAPGETIPDSLAELPVGAKGA